MKVSQMFKDPLALYLVIFVPLMGVHSFVQLPCFCRSPAVESGDLIICALLVLQVVSYP